ncbi:hypothetical protein FOZ62_018787, partial [Perkinsus olseni]
MLITRHLGTLYRVSAGNAREIEHDGLAIHWTLDDFTGSVRCKMYLEESDTVGRGKVDEILKKG